MDFVQSYLNQTGGAGSNASAASAYLDQFSTNANTGGVSRGEVSTMGIVAIISVVVVLGVIYTRS